MEVLGGNVFPFLSTRVDQMNSIYMVFGGNVSSIPSPSARVLGILGI